MTEDYDSKLCDERHQFIVETFDKHDGRIRKVENRFIAILATLIANLLGIVGVLGVLLLG